MEIVEVYIDMLKYVLVIELVKKIMLRKSVMLILKLEVTMVKYLNMKL